MTGTLLRDIPPLSERYKQDETMNVLIGISRNCKETETFLYENFKNSRERTVVGPFSSPEAASKWMTFIIARTEGYEKITLPPQSTSDSFWYGFTVESPEILGH